MRYCAIISSSEIDDWSNSCVTQIWACDTKCDTIEDFFHGQTLIKFIFKLKLWHNVSFVPHFNPNLPKVLEISKFGAHLAKFRAHLEHVIKYTQYSSNQSVTETNAPIFCLHDCTGVVESKQHLPKHALLILQRAKEQGVNWCLETPQFTLV